MSQHDMERLFHIVYASTATEPLSREELHELLKGSHERNARVGITGLLLYKDGCFMQVIEGEEEAVSKLFSKISADARHHHVIVLLREPMNERLFPTSLMAFRDLNHESVKSLPGYSEFLDTPLNGELLKKDLPKTQRLLLLFKKNIR